MGKLRTALLVAVALVTILGSLQTISLQAATPTLVQHVSTSTNQLERGNTFIISLPNLALQNNCLILALTYSSSSSLYGKNYRQPRNEHVGRRADHQQRQPHDVAVLRAWRQVRHADDYGDI